tara:strand:- start:736 stop:936 length:201 start_codon:yes stop_codon:yes gene_type:complete
VVDKNIAIVSARCRKNPAAPDLPLAPAHAPKWDYLGYHGINWFVNAKTSKNDEKSECCMEAICAAK